MREYERRQPGGGNHAMAKEILAALVAAEVGTCHRKALVTGELLMMI